MFPDHDCLSSSFVNPAPDSRDENRICGIMASSTTIWLSLHSRDELEPIREAIKKKGMNKDNVLKGGSQSEPKCPNFCPNFT